MVPVADPRFLDQIEVDAAFAKAFPGFAEEARRQSKLLAGQPEEIEALDFIERAADLDGWV